MAEKPLVELLEKGKDVGRAESMTGGRWRMYASANFERLAIGCINADFCNQTIGEYLFFSSF